MVKRNDSIKLEELLSNGTWVRRLARELLYDPASVDDVVQEVWITALHRPPADPGALSAWLRRVVRTFAFRANRSASRRVRRERQPRPEPEIPTPSEVAERFETQGLLARAIADLDDPYRTVLYLRFYEELTAVEIGECLGQPASTIRTQLSRAVQRLRDRLDTDPEAHLGSDWRARLLALVLPAGFLLGAPAAVSAAQAASPQAGTRWAPVESAAIGGAVLVVLLLLAFGWWLTGDARPPESAAVDTTVAQRSADRAPGGRVASGSDADAIAAAHRVDGAESVATAAVAADESAVRPTIYEGARRIEATSPLWVVDSVTEQPIGGASVYIFREVEIDSTLIGTTPSIGELRMPNEVLCRDSLIVFADGYVEYREPATLRDLDGDPYVIAMTPEFGGRVEVRGIDGEPASDIEIEVSAVTLGLAAPAARRIRTDSDGIASYQVRDYTTVLTVRQPGTAVVSQPAVTPLARIQLEVGREVTGVLTDADGEPVTAAYVEVTSQRSRTAATIATTDDEGRFDLGGMAADDAAVVSFHHPDYPSFRAQGVPPASGDWRFEIPRGEFLRGRVVDDAGEAVTEAVVFVMAPKRGPEPVTEGVISSVETRRLKKRGRARHRLMPLHRTTTGEAGEFELGPITEITTECYLFVFDPKRQNHLQRLDLEDLRRERSIQLESGGVVEGIVTSPSGEPVAGVMLHFGEIWSNDTENIVGRVRTDGAGRFRFEGVPELVSAPLAGNESVVRSHLFVMAFPPDLLLELNGDSVDSSSIAGALALEPGTAAVELVTATRSHGATIGLRLVDGDGLAVRTWTPTVIYGADGEERRGTIGMNTRQPFFYTDHTISTDEVQDCQVLLMPDGYRWRWVDVADVRRDRSVDVTLEARRGGTRICIVDIAGVPQPGAVVCCELVGPRRSRWVTLGQADREGCLRVDCLEPGVYRFAASALTSDAPPAPGSSLARVPTEYRSITIRAEEQAAAAPELLRVASIAVPLTR